MKFVNNLNGNDKMETQNKNITEDYVSIDTAKLLKKKGFDIPVRAFYNPKYNRGKKVITSTALIDYNTEEYMSKKIMFSDKFGLTAAVLAGTKTQTRRIVPNKAFDAWNDIDDGDEYSRSVYADSYDTKMRNFLLKYAPFKVGEVVSIAQTYFDIKTSANSYRPPIWKGYKDWHKYLESLPTNGRGYYNKMFVRAELMPHKIKITNIRVQRLQDISEDECLTEGIIKYTNSVYTYIKNGKNPKFDTPRKAYAELIDSISGKGTFEKNPWVFAYNFQLIKSENGSNN